MPMPLDAPLFLAGPPGSRSGHPPPRAAKDLAWPWEPPKHIAQGVPTDDMFVNVGPALGGIQQPCSAL